MQRLDVSGAVRPLQELLGVKGLKVKDRNQLIVTVLRKSLEM